MGSERSIFVGFFVEGKVVPGGSKRAFVNPKTGRSIITDDAGKPNKMWRQAVAAVAKASYQGPIEFGAIKAVLTFYRPRPKGHYGSGKRMGELKRSAPVYCTKIPDVLKLARAVEDALSGIIYHDDSQIVSEHLYKLWADPMPPGVRIDLTFLGRTNNEPQPQESRPHPAFADAAADASGLQVD